MLTSIRVSSWQMRTDLPSHSENAYFSLYNSLIVPGISASRLPLHAPLMSSTYTGSFFVVFVAIREVGAVAKEKASAKADRIKEEVQQNACTNSHTYNFPPPIHWLNLNTIGAKEANFRGFQRRPQKILTHKAHSWGLTCRYYKLYFPSIPSSWLHFVYT